jgi:hypothetical protein
MPFTPPKAVTLHLIDGVELAFRNKTFGQTQGHGSVIGPLSCFQVMRATSHHVGDRLESAPRRKLDGCSDRIANG